MKPYANALVVGKFAPLHHGHEALFGNARGLSRSLLVLSYAVPEPAGCAAALREQWLHLRCPDARCIVLDEARLRQRCLAQGLLLKPMPRDDAPGPEHWAWLAWCLAELLQAPIDVMVGSEDYVRPCAAQLSRALGRPVAAELFDPPRVRVPVSASAIRDDPVAMRHWLAPEVADT
jgi:hypothetical protein